VIAKGIVLVGFSANHFCYKCGHQPFSSYQ
jgi:hypothetical protein